MKKLIIVLFAVVLGFSSCSKDPEKLITDKNWKLSSITISPAIDWDGYGTMVTDVLAQFEDCTKDDLTIFNDNGTVDFDEGATKCAQSDPQTVSGTWAFNTTEDVISITTAGETDSWNIIDLDKKTLKTTYQDDFNTSTTYTLTATYKN